MEANKSILDTLFKNKPLLVSVLVLLILVPIIFLAISLSNRPAKFALQTAVPANGESINPQESNIVLEFNQELPIIQKDTFEISISPEVEFVYGIIDNKLQINISGLWLLAEQTYDVTLRNLVSRENQVIRHLTTSFMVRLDSEAVSFLENLPYDGGGFTIDNVSNRTLYVNITDKPEEEYEEESKDLLNGLGLTSTKFNIDINLPSKRSKFDDDLIRH